MPMILSSPNFEHEMQGDATTAETPTSPDLPTPLLEEGIIDEHLAQLAMSAVQTGTLTPLIKEELKMTIQNKRMLNGQEEIKDLGQSLAIRPRKLSAEEEERVVRRRERNKFAAQRCRAKRREKAESLEQETIELLSAQEKLKLDIKTLQQERENLLQMLLRHDKSTQCDDKMVHVETVFPECGKGGAQEVATETVVMAMDDVTVASEEWVQSEDTESSFDEFEGLEINILD